MRGANLYGFSFRAVQLGEVVTHPHLNLLLAGGED